MTWQWTVVKMVLPLVWSNCMESKWVLPKHDHLVFGYILYINTSLINVVCVEALLMGNFVNFGGFCSKDRLWVTFPKQDTLIV